MLHYRELHKMFAIVNSKLTYNSKLVLECILMFEMGMCYFTRTLPLFTC